MTQITLYTGGGVSLSPVYEEGRTQSAYVCLQADDGKALQNGEIITTCINVLATDVSNWTEIDEPEPPEPDPEPEELLNILVGENE